MIVDKQTLACESSGVIQTYYHSMYCKDGGEPQHTEFLWTLHTGSRLVWTSLCMLLFIVSLRCHRFHHWHHRHRRSRFSLSGNSSLPRLLSLLCPALSSWLVAKSWGIVCRCAWREASPSALGEHVVWECLRWHSFKLSPTQHAGVCLSWMTMLNPPPSKGAFSGWGDTSDHVDFTVLTNKRDSNVNKK